MAGKYIKIDEDLIEDTNIARRLDEETRSRIAESVIERYNVDEDSRSEWKDINSAWLKLAQQLIEHRNFPWPDAANVKYPLLTVAAIQFHSRSYPALIKGRNPVLAKTIGADGPELTNKRRAERVGKFMSFQVLNDMPDWQDDMDRLFMLLPIIGLSHKKSYFSPKLRGPVSELVSAADLVINYYATDYDTARKTQVIPLSKNAVIEHQRAGFFLDEDLGEPNFKTHEGDQRSSGGESVLDLVQGLRPPSVDTGDIPHTILEAHDYYDLDGDGYKEPYILTVDKDSGKLLRIVARFDADGVIINEKDEIARIEPIEYFTRYFLLPDPNSKIYAMGLGTLLGPMNHAVNTLTNQLIDAGTLSNLQPGFLGKGVRVKGGIVRFKPGEWKYTQTTGDDLRKGVYPLPVREPSNVLFSLLSMLIDSGNNIASITDVMMGENPGQNQPYSTTVQVLEQGMKVFTGIYKRIYRSMAKEYEKLFKLNQKYPDPERYQNVLNDQSANILADFNLGDFNVLPAADPDLVSEAQKLVRAEALLQKMQMGLQINPQVVTQRVLEAEGHEDIEELMNIPDPGPPPEIQLKMKELELEKEANDRKYELDRVRVGAEAKKDQAQAIALGAKADTADFEATTKRIDSLNKAAAADEKNKIDKEKTNKQTTPTK